MRYFLYFFFSVFTIISANGVNVYNRKLTDPELSCSRNMASYSPSEIAKRFKACSRNVVEETAIDYRLSSLIERVASNSHGKNILIFVVTKLEPVVECAKSLIEISKVLKNSDKESVVCALNFLNEIIPFSGASDLAQKVGTVQNECNNLLKNPKKFTCNKSEDILSRFDKQKISQVQTFFLKNLSFLKNVVDSAIDLLLARTFELAIGENMFYHLNNKISISIGNTTISNIVTGPKLFYSQSGVGKRVDSVVCQRREIGEDVRFVHELSHYIRKVFDGIIAKDFLQLLPKLNFLPYRYTTNSIEKIFSDDEEFRNITGIFIKNNTLFFDPMTEAGYVIANNKGLRNSHNVSFIPRMPIGLLLKIEELSGQKLRLEEGELEYSELLNLW